jgi:hypothetical protein
MAALIALAVSNGHIGPDQLQQPPPPPGRLRSQKYLGWRLLTKKAWLVISEPNMK